MKHEKTSFNNQDVVLDNNEFYECNFENCTLFYGGEKPPTLNNCSFSGVKWNFVGAAANTISFMKALYHGCGEGGRTLIEETFKGLKTSQDSPKTTLH
jgi:hypothetical protein